MREYDIIEVDTVDEADLFRPGMAVLVGDSIEEWIVESITTRFGGGYVITVYQD